MENNTHNENTIKDIALLDAIRDRILIELYLALEALEEDEEGTDAS